ncbi:hypothetical protein PHYBLDRAFT_173285 [Phycomyces blakesleeanus NRRL 1555(-)]|uniref:MULE transposase domain-containing protein n=1 Tax=Phycomyces blakesleeanus (strain ATCC 8743b / DSM 1359 / FGSC 10004 / NBRC 33097 / NRRL 1555) TaxID=763407 RepID=A0A167KK60_PHYB8|nr:hypothetical protein PHYBLDRAFT_173285 [Phycomyces blakesleeanus NRRL 1555(-)]OAD68279.1 hypothetical protein PHYBLDRAFT_173285 [Phycomyces blakesleeanus NRRL 1555(-)]|eukprot:XP_018286319.1 hypothetical protein PHYBLDRAFT_173285 [Phycomyces blakesleeanus NRRL 1555(-)]
MIDCSPIEIGALEEVFGGSVDTLLCHWHIKRAWEVNVKKHIKVQNLTQTSNIACNSVHAVLSNLMHAETSQVFDVSYSEFLEKFEDSGFPRRHFSSAIFHTNNYIESYHNQLKTFYLGRARSLCIDRLIYLLAKVLTLDYRQKNVKTLYGFKAMHLSHQEELKKKKTYMLDIDKATSMNLSSAFSSSSSVQPPSNETSAVVDPSILSDEIAADIDKYIQLYSAELKKKVVEYKGRPEDLGQFVDPLKSAYNKLKEHGTPSQSRPPRQF